MNISEAFISGFKKYATFKGVATRSEYWYWVLAWSVFSALAGLLGGKLNLSVALLGFSASANNPALNLTFTVVSLATLIPSLALITRRLHDTGRSGWWGLLPAGLVIGALVMTAITAAVFAADVHGAASNISDALSDVPLSNTVSLSMAGLLGVSSLILFVAAIGVTVLLLARPSKLEDNKYRA